MPKYTPKEYEELLNELLEDGYSIEEAEAVCDEEFGYINKPTNWIT